MDIKDINRLVGEEIRVCGNGIAYGKVVGVAVPDEGSIIITVTEPKFQCVPEETRRKQESLYKHMEGDK